MTQGEVFALKNALESREFKSAFAQFLEEQASRVADECIQALNGQPVHIEHAISLAAQARVFAELLNRLEEFTREQLGRT
jgi:hypothetical protein